MPYDEETRRLIENRKRNAEYRKEQQIKKRKMTLAGLGIVIALLVIIIIIAASCSAKRDEEVEINPTKETIILGVTTAEETTVVSTEVQSTTVSGETTSVSESTTGETRENESSTSIDENTVKYTNDTVNIRKEANQDSIILEVLEKDEMVEVLGTEGEWTKVKWGDIQGYISSELLKD